MKWGVILFLASRIEYTVESWEIMIKNIVLQRPCTFRKLMVCAAAAVQVFDQQRSCKQIIDFDTSFKDDSDRAIITNVTLWHFGINTTPSFTNMPISYACHTHHTKIKIHHRWFFFHFLTMIRSRFPARIKFEKVQGVSYSFTILPS